MFFHIDESGNTGNNLFDQNQPTLSYGLLSSRTNVDALGKAMHRRMLNKVGGDSLHANVLGVNKLTEIAPELYSLQKKMKFKFDYYFIRKPDYALVHFFDVVFDAGLNPAVKWETYWTPLRYVFIWKLSILFDKATLKKSWELCIDKKIFNKDDEVVSLLKELLIRLENSNLDPRSKELMTAAFRFGINNPMELDFGKTDPKIVSPNAVCFQFIVSAMARHARASGRKNAFGITVDQQSQFNNSQVITMQHASMISDGINNSDEAEKRRYTAHPLYYKQIDEKDILGIGIPKKKIDISDSQSSIGLQIVDIYLWITNRFLNKKELSLELKALAHLFLKDALIDGISMEGMMQRWNQFEKHLPQFDSLDLAMLDQAETSKAEHRSHIQQLDIEGRLYKDGLSE